MVSTAQPGASSMGGEVATRGIDRRALRDPLEAVLSLGSRHYWVGAAFGLAGALTVHGAGAATSLPQLYEMEAFAGGVLEEVQREIRVVYDVEYKTPPPPPAVEEEEEAVEEEPEVEPQVTEAADEPVAPATPPPAAAEVGEALTMDEDAPLDLTGANWSMVTGPGTRFRGGVSQRGGTSKVAVRDKKAKAGGDPKVKKSNPAPKRVKKKKKDMSRTAMLASSSSWNSCGFPAEAEMGQIDYARVGLVVTVGPSGSPERVAVVSESPSGYGFGSLAQSCAYRKQFKPGLDRDGNPTTSTTPQINVTFTR